MNKIQSLLRSHEEKDGLRCYKCFLEYPTRTALFKETRGLINHLYLSHVTTEKEIDNLKKVLREYRGGSFLRLCFKRGILK